MNVCVGHTADMEPMGRSSILQFIVLTELPYVPSHTHLL